MFVLQFIQDDNDRRVLLMIVLIPAFLHRGVTKIPHGLKEMNEGWPLAPKITPPKFRSAFRLCMTSGSGRKIEQLESRRYPIPS
ncbi:hypothetical protein PGT21_017460 [Puccinia graminis f. sp. tritici]|uniref:Uncharacterized protein n=1 Tax=Puccinia graminis f. sp. tritici TaxID=56615 RepID=A0A5B0NVV0_PUCGR|nr:hypothetical protein PGT21_017460 [Puccinia graminis f. sp. tritici]KAA1093331.1 hypothetical protein PGTUg99_022392 [Puccinia graminis f. sp. tritici]